ncbi:MAG: hypothetical protein KIG16_04075, partial [Eubacteriales bacterium]|nr:hypothetical protein [Eubacteriales bacterium]
YDQYYGIEYDVTVSNPDSLTRIGKMELHKSLPCQSGMRRCMLNDDGTVNYYLGDTDSTKRDTGSAANLTGADGMVMVEMPDMYVRFEHDGNKRRTLFSIYALPGFAKWSKMYGSAYEASLNRTNNKLSSVVNVTADYRGGVNNASWDGTYRSLLGMPVTNINLTAFRTYARNRGTNWNCNTYEFQKRAYWMFVVEYATLNSQKAFNAELNSEGYHQGGLGDGVTILNYSKWGTFNSYNPFIPCGTTNSLGNKTGVVSFTMPTEYDATKPVVSVPSYRGIENPFGHIWKITDGVKFMIQSEADGGKSLIYVCDNPANYSSSGVTGYELRGELPRSDGYVKTICHGEHGDILPTAVGAGSTSYFCDYFYTNIPESGTAERACFFGGSAYHGADAGFVYAHSANSASLAYADCGSRLCFLPS